MPKGLEINLDEMTDEELVEIFKAYIQIDEEKKEDTLSQLLERAILIEGKKGRGKTVSAVGLSYELREKFGRPVVTIGSKMGLKPAFGPFKAMSEIDFKNELEKITVAATEEANAEQVANAFDKYGISIMYATLVFDEAYKLLDARRASDKLIQLFGYFVAQSRHYHVTMLIICPDREMIDKRVRMQFDWQGRVYHNAYTDVARLRLVSGVDVITYDINCASNVEHVPFYDMYDSWTMLGYRKANLNIKNF